MHVLIIGHGGREASLAWRIARSPRLRRLTVTGPNPGWPGVAEVAPASTIDEQLAFVRQQQPGLVVVGPEGPLAGGIADRIRALDIPCFGPDQAAARIETSKSFAKQLMVQAGVPTAQSFTVDPTDDRAVEQAMARMGRGDVVLKVDGLAAGKGVFVCRSAAQARAAWDEIVGGRFGDAARTILIEDRLEGPEVSVFALTDGSAAVGLPSCQDHKALRDGGEGPNTGGMGSYTPCPLLDDAGVEGVLEAVHRPIIHALADAGRPFRGVLYAGLMLTADGPRVLEFNARFGDPECQVLMALWSGDILPWLLGAATGRLPAGRPRFAAGAACCVVLASRGYPQSSERDVVIPEGPSRADVVVFHAGSRRGDDGFLRTAGGRVLGVTARAPDLAEARLRAYRAVEDWRFDGCQVRTDIALAATR